MTDERHTGRRAIVLTAAACATLGWALGTWQSADSEVATARAPEPAPKVTPVRLATGQLIAVASDGRATLHVDQQPLSWVIEEIERQSGGPLCAERKARPDAAPRAVPAPASAPRIAAVAPPAPSRDPDAVGTILRGAEPERYDGLLQAVGAGGGVPASVLQTLYETDGSPRVRLLAFEAALEAHAGDVGALRSALEAAQRLPDPAIAQDAGRRLEELERTQLDTAPQASER